MLIIWEKTKRQILQAIWGLPEYTIVGNKMYLSNEVLINDLTKVEYKYIQDIEIPMKIIEGPDGEPIEVMPTIDEIIVVDLPESEIPDSTIRALYKMTFAQLDTYIDANVTTLAQARTFLKKLAKVVLILVKRERMG